MKKNYSVLIVIIILFLAGCASIMEKALIYKMENAPLGPNQKNIAEELGYDANAKLIVVNSDDTGGHPAFTEGTFKVMKFGLVKSTSVLVNDRNDSDLAKIAKIAKQNPEWGIGIHLSLTNEYQEAYPWTPVLSQEEVPSLYNAKGLAWEKIEEIEKNVNPDHAAMEFEAQIRKALKSGIQLTHIDSHMGTYYRNCKYPGADPDGLRRAAIKVAEKFGLPMTMNTFDKKSEASMQYMDLNNLIRPDTFFGFYELEEMNSHLSYEGSFIKRWITGRVVKIVFGLDLPYKNYDKVADDLNVRMEIYKQAISNVAKPGLNHFFMHAAAPKAANGSSIPVGKNHEPGEDKIVRMSDSEVWSSDEMKYFLEKQGIELVNYTKLKIIQQERQKTK